MKVSIKEIRQQTMHVLSGGILTESFFLKNAGFMLLIFIMIVLSISNRYSCLSKIGEVQELKRELKDVKYESLVVSTELTGVSRRSQIQTLVNEKGMELRPSHKPVYEIEE
jgi:cell division protein FtsL